jgi:hypothetical protein
MKTALQELLEWIDSEEGRLLEDAWWEIQIKIQELLSKEKERLEDAYNKGVTYNRDLINFSEYFEKTYGEENN